MTRKQPTLRQLQAGLDESLTADRSRFEAGFAKKKGEGVQFSMYGMVRNLRAKAALAFLLDADREAFFEHSYQAAVAFDLSNRLIKAGMPHNQHVYSLTNSRGFIEALLTYRPADARRTVDLMPDEMRDKDDPAKFWLIGFLMRLTTGSEQGPQIIIGELRELAQAGTPVDVEIELCESLHQRDAARFTDAVRAYLDRRLGQVAENYDVNLGEQSISPEGLALRRVAANLGMEVQIRHKLTPLELQGDYPSPDAFSRGVVPEVGPEVDRAEFWEDWPPVRTW